MQISERRRGRQEACSKAEAGVQLFLDSEQPEVKGMENLAAEEESMRRKPKGLYTYPKLLELISKFNKVAGCKLNVGYKVKNQLHILY